MPQPPQFRVWLSVSTQARKQLVLGPQFIKQKASQHWFAQTLPTAPQLAGSDWRSTQPPAPSSVSPGRQAQLPALQT